MMRQERAKQFMPFDAMKGLQEALRDREERHSRVEKHDISEEQMEKNSEIFMRLNISRSLRSLESHISIHLLMMLFTLWSENRQNRKTSLNIHFALTPNSGYSGGI